jgi:hypothetical protein
MERIGFSCEARRSSLAGTSFLSWKEFSEILEDGQCGFMEWRKKTVLGKPDQWSQSRRWYAVKGIVTMLGQYQQGDVVIVFGPAVFYPLETRVLPMEHSSFKYWASCGSVHHVKFLSSIALTRQNTSSPKYNHKISIMIWHFISSAALNLEFY